MAYIDNFDAMLGPDGKLREELFVEDRLHFDEDGYKILVASVRPYLQKT